MVVRARPLAAFSDGSYQESTGSIRPRLTGSNGSHCAGHLPATTGHLASGSCHRIADAERTCEFVRKGVLRLTEASVNHAP